MKQSANRFERCRFLLFSITLTCLLLISAVAYGGVSTRPASQMYVFPEGVTQLDLKEPLKPVDMSGNEIKGGRNIPGTVQIWNEHTEKYDTAQNGTVIVQFKNAMSATKVEKKVQTLGCSISSSLRVAPLHILTITDGMTLQQKLRQLRSDPSVALAEPNLLTYVAYVPNDPFYDRQYHHPLIQAEQAWDLAYPAGLDFSDQVVVAIVDTGVDHVHEDLVGLLWRNDDEVPGNGIDDDANGFIDDATGWDFFDNDNTVFPSPDGIDNDGNGYIDDGVEHGTHCAGICAAVVDNGIGIAGVCWNAEIMAIRSLGDEGYGTIGGVMEGIDYAVSNGADVVSLSLSGGYTDAYTILLNAVREFYPHVVVCAAAGNYGIDLDVFQLSPVCNDGFDEEDNLVVGVAASDRFDFKASFSDYSATYVDITAPGVSIYSTVYYNPKYNFMNKYDYFDGTSMACPMVAGAIAVLKNVIGPDLSAEEAILRLKMGADNIDLYNPAYVGELGAGRVNLYSMVESASDEIPPTPTPTPIPHAYPVIDLMPPYSDPMAVVGLDLYHPSGQTVLDQITVQFESIPGSVGGFTREDLAELDLNENSGVALYKDRFGLTRGAFDWTGEGSTSLNDILVPLESIEYFEGRTDGKEGFRVVMTIDTDRSEAIIPSSTDNGLFDYFIVIRSSGTLAHDDTVGVDIPARGIRAIDRSLQQGTLVEFFDESYPTEETRKPVYGEIVQFINYTQEYQEYENDEDMLLLMDVEKHPVKQLSPPTEVIGINAWGHPSHNYQLERVVVTIVNVRDANSDMFNPLATAPEELTTSGLALYRDVEGTNDGVFDGPGKDEIVLLDGTQHWTPIFDEATGAIREWRVVLTPLEPQKLTVPPNDTQDGNVGADYFVVLRTSDRLRNLQTFRPEIGSDGLAAPSAQLRAMNGRVYLRSGDQTSLRTRREITKGSKETSGERIYDMMARPVPEFTFHDVTPKNFILRESRTFPVIGIDMQDFGASAAYEHDRDTWSYVLRDISFDVISDNPQQPVLPEYFRPIASNRPWDPLYHEEEFDSGFALYWDDDTPIGDFMDEDEQLTYPIGLYDEELLDHKDNDDDGLIDEDLGDLDPAGQSGFWDPHDDYIPFFARNYGFVSEHANNSAFVTAPTASMLVGEPGFQVKFNMIIRRNCESHDCDTLSMMRFDAGDMNNNEPFGERFFRFSEWPVVAGTVQFPGCGGCGTCGGPYLWNGMGYLMSCSPLPACPTSGCNDRRITYDHFIEIPDDDVDELYGDDMYITLRTNHVFPNGMQFKVRVNSGAITYDKFHRIIQPILYPGSSATGVTTRAITGVIQIFNRIEAMFTADKWIDYKAPSQNLPTPVLGFNINIGGSPESYEQEFSFEQIDLIVVDFIDEGGLQLSISDPSASDLLPLNGTGTAGLSLYFDNGSSFGALDSQDTAIGLIASATKDLVKTDFGYRLTLRSQSGQMPVPFDDDLTYNGDGTVKYQNNGVDYFLCVRPSRNISFNDRFRIRLSSNGDFLKGTTDQIQAEGAESVTSGLLKAAIPTNLTDLTGSERIIMDADKSPRRSVVGLNFWDGRNNGDDSPVVDRTEYLDALNVTIVPQGQGFKKTDLAPMSLDESSGIALYRDVYNPNDPSSREGFFDPGDEFIEPSTVPNFSTTAIEGAPNAFQISLRYYQGVVDIPPDDEGEYMGPDYFIVIRTSTNVENNQSFSVYMRPDQAIRYSSGSSSATLWTEPLITRIDAVPNIQMIKPEELGTLPENYQVQISWNATDPDSDATIDIYYSTDDEYQGTLIEEGILEQDGLGLYTWDIRDVPSGTYFVYGVITDMEDKPRDPALYPGTRDYASGNVIIRNTAPTFAFIAPALGVADVSETFLIRWSASDLENDALISLYYTTEVGQDGVLIAGGLSENSVNEFLWRVNSVKPGTYYVYAIIDDGVNPPKRVYSSGQVRITFTNRQQAGFPIDTGDSMFSSPVLYDFDGDSVSDLAVGSDDGKLYVVNGTGTILPGFPVNLGARVQSSPAVGDVVGSTSPEIVVPSIDGGIYVLNTVGQFINRNGQVSSARTKYASISGGLMTSAALGDLDEDGKKDIVIPDGAGNLVILYSAGQTRTVALGSQAIVTAPAIADIDRDGLLEIAIGETNKVFVVENDGSIKAGYPISLPSILSSSISVGDLTSDSGLEMAFGTQDRQLHLLSAQGAEVTGFPVMLSSALRASPVITYFCDPSSLFLIAATSDSTVSVMAGDGIILNSVKLGGHIYAAPACADIVGATDLACDGLQEIVVATDQGKLFALTGDLQDAMTSASVPQPFANVEEAIYTGPAVGDIDGDADPDVVFADNGNRIQAWDLIGQDFGLSVNAWPMFRHDPAHTGYLAKPPVALLGDHNGDGIVDSADLFVLSERWREVRSPSLSAAQDVNANDMLDDAELLLFVQFWHKNSE